MRLIDLARGTIVQTIQHRAARGGSHRVRFPIAVILGGGALVLLCLLAAFAAWFMTAPKPSPQLSVSVDEPFNGDLAEVNQPRIVRASTEHTGGVQRLELYADGALMASEEADDSSDSTLLILVGSWIPLNAGRHILIARAYAPDG